MTAIDLRPPPFPISVHELTTDMLSDSLGLPVSAFTPTRIGADRGMLGEIFLLDLEYDDGAAGPASIVAKFAALREGSLASARRGRAHERELRCFVELLVDTPVDAPDCFGAWYDPETAHFLLLQSAVDNDGAVDQITGLSVDDARLVLRQVARLHARWWRDPTITELDWLPRLDGEGRVHNLTTIAGAGWAGLCDLLEDHLTPSERGLGAELPARVEHALRTVAALPSTLIHSDLRADNLLFAPDHSAVTLIDWQGCGLGPPGFDLAYFMAQSLTVDDRRANEAELLEFYRAELDAAGVALTTEEVRAGYAESMIYSLVIASALPLVGDPSEARVRDLATSMARRSIEAMRDHDQLWETS